MAEPALDEHTSFPNREYAMLLQTRGHHLFTLWDVDVSATFWYGFLLAFIAVFWPAIGAISVTQGVLYALVVTGSLLIHEFGHAFVAKRYGLGPSVLLHAFGGFTRTDREAQTDGDEAKLLFAGPLVGLVVAGLAAAVYVLLPQVMAVSPILQTLIPAIMWVNLVWSIFNLALPIWPYDGGRLFHLFLRQIQDEEKARNLALNASIFTVIPVGIIGVFAFGRLIVAFLAFFVVMDNIQRLKSGQSLIRRDSDRSKGQASDFHEELLEDAREAMDDQDWSEAARLGHQMRSLGSMPEEMLQEVWTILGIATMKQGDYEEALSYLERAPEDSEVVDAIERCEKEIEGEAATG